MREATPAQLGQLLRSQSCSSKVWSYSSRSSPSSSSAGRATASPSPLPCQESGSPSGPAVSPNTSSARSAARRAAERSRSCRWCFQRASAASRSSVNELEVIIGGLPSPLRRILSVWALPLLPIGRRAAARAQAAEQDDQRDPRDEADHVRHVGDTGAGADRGARGVEVLE